METLYWVFVSLHIVVAIAMIAFVLLQTGKGAGLSGVFGAAGNSSESFFGGRGPGSFLAKLTTASAILFMVTCLALAKFSATPRGGHSVVRDKAKTTEKAPVKPKPKPAAPTR